MLKGQQETACLRPSVPLRRYFEWASGMEETLLWLGAGWPGEDLQPNISEGSAGAEALTATLSPLRTLLELC